MKPAVAGLVALALVPGLAAHTREKERIDAVEAQQLKVNAQLVQQLKDATDAAARLGESIKEREQHAALIERKLEGLRADLQAALGGMKEAVGMTVDEKLAALERRVESQAALAAQAEALDHERLSREIAGLGSSLAAFRSYLTTFAGAIEGRLSALERETKVMRLDQARDREAVDQRLQALLKAVDDENQKLRGAIARLSGAPVPGRVHVIKAGESLYAIAKQYGTTVEALKKVNPSLDQKVPVLKAGNQVVIPGP